MFFTESRFWCIKYFINKSFVTYFSIIFIRQRVHGFGLAQKCPNARSNFQYRSLPVINESQHDTSNKINCAPSTNSGQPGHPPSLIRVFAVRSMDSQWLKVSSCGQRRFWSDWTDARADMSFRCANMSFCWVCHAAAPFWVTVRQRQVQDEWTFSIFVYPTGWLGPGFFSSSLVLLSQCESQDIYFGETKASLYFFLFLNSIF